MLTALGWYGILRYAYPGGTTYMEVLAAYAVGVALNNYVPANMGTFVTLLMFVAVVRGATFPGVLAGYMVRDLLPHRRDAHLRLPVLAGFRVVRLPVRQRAGCTLEPPGPHPRHHGGGIVLVALLLRIFWRWVKVMWAKAKQGAAILGDFGATPKWVCSPRRAATRRRSP